MNNRKIFSALVVASMSSVLLLTGCSSNGGDTSGDDVTGDSVTTDSSEQDDPNSDDSDGIEVDKNLLSVEVTLPASLVSLGTETPPTEDELKQAIAEDGSNMKVRLNDDGSATYKMSKREHKRILEEQRRSTVELIDDGIAEESGIYKSVTFSDDLREFDVTVDREALENSMSFFGLTLVMSGSMYQAFAGQAEQYVIIRYMDESTGEIFSTYDTREEM